MKTIIACLCLLLVVAACAPTEPTSAPTSVPPTATVAEPTTGVTEESTSTAGAEATVATTAVVAAETETASETPLRVGVLPVINALPLYVAELERFYQEEGVTVDVVTFAGAREREQAMQDGTIDGETTDLVTVILLNNAGYNLRAVRSDSTVTPFFSIVVNGDSAIETVDDLKGVPIAVAENTVLAYMTRVILREGGLAEDEINLVNIASISSRIDALESGAVAAATLPEPLTAQVVAGGARVVANDATTDVVPTVLAFSETALNERGDNVRAFLRAYERAVEAINTRPDDYAGLFIASAGLPDSLTSTYEIPQYQTAGLVSADELDAMIAWMDANGLMRRRLDNSAYVDRAYLP